MRIGRFFAALSVACTLGVAASLPAHAQTAKAALKDAGGKEVGTVQLIQTPHGVLLKMALKSHWRGRLSKS